MRNQQHARRVIGASLAVLALLLTPHIRAHAEDTTPDNTVESEYDKFKDLTRVSVTGAFGHGFMSRARFSFSGKTVTPPATIRVTFDALGSFGALDGAHIIFLYGGKRFDKLADASYSAGASGVWETAGVSVPLSDFVDMTRAKKVEYEIGDSPGAVEGDDLGGWVKLRDAMGLPPEPKPAPDAK